jgi:GNAT superfamily N-acetyltransferase
MLHPATHSLAAALADDPFYRAGTVAAGSDEALRLQLLAAYFQLAWDEARAVGEIQAQGADGAALWTLPKADGAADHGARRTTALQPLLGAQGFAAYQAICEAMASQLPPALENAWYLSILGVHPDARGQGLAQRLLAPTLARADAAGASCFLETFNPLSLPFYARLGFAPSGEFLEPITQRRYCLLVR